jgi:cytochrome c551/c552
MGNFIKVIIFSLVVVGLMTMDQFIALGDEIFKGKGTCTLCHNPVVKRAPLLEQVAAITDERLKDSRYQGEAKNSEEYIYESMIKPSVFVVAGFGVKGTNDTISPMPDVSKGAIGLSEPEIKAVISFLQDTAGVDVTVEIPRGEPAKEEKKVAETPPPAMTPEEAVAKFGCGACHKIAGQAGAIGPDLTAIGKARGAEYIRRSIIDPNADIAEGFPPGMMPPDYKDRMTAGELEMLVNYMVKSK